MIDKRIIKTRNGIKNAFMQLVFEKDIGKLTISDLTKKAQINRSTFYLHYNGLEAVMKDIDDEIELKITDCLNNFDINQAYESCFRLFEQLTDMLNEAPMLKRYILDSTSSQQIITHIKDIFISKALDSLIVLFPDKSQDKLLFPVTFAASGILDTYVKWTHSDNQTTVEELITTISHITQMIIKSISEI